MKRWLSRSHLNRGGDIRSNEGYTILETMIVLAVTGAMFASIMVLFRGRQARVEFAQAVRDYEAMLQNITSDVTRGYYATGGLKCTLNGVGTPELTSDNTVGAGANGDCIFLGYTIEPAGKTNEVNTLIGSRFSSASSSVAKKESLGVLMEMIDGAGNNIATPPLLKRTTTNSYQLNVSKIVSLADTSQSVKMLAFTNYAMIINSEELNSQVSVLAFREPIIHSGKIDRDLFTGGSSFKNLLIPSSSSVLLGSKGVLFCLEGQNGQKAEIRLGENDLSNNIFTTIDTHPVTGVDPCA